MQSTLSLRQGATGLKGIGRDAASMLCLVALMGLLSGCSLNDLPTESDLKDAPYLRADEVFYRALKLGDGQPISNRVALMQRLYVEGTSTLVGNYVRNRTGVGGADLSVGLEALLNYVDQHRSFYDAVGQYFAEHDPEPPVRKAIETVGSLTGRSASTQVTFFIGMHTANAFVDAERVGIALEWFLPLSSPALSQLEPSASEAIQRAGGYSRMSIWAAHEYAHVLLHLPLRTLLDIVINEGLAVQASELAVPGRPPQEYLGFDDAELSWALDRETQIWQDFLAVRDSADVALIQSYTTAEGRPYPDGPGRLGYFIGYRIAQSYLSSFGNLRFLFSETSTQAILDHSGYLP